MKEIITPLMREELRIINNSSEQIKSYFIKDRKENDGDGKRNKRT